MGLALSCAGVVAEYHGRWFLRHRFNGEAARKERGMEVRAHLEEFDRLLNTLLPAIVQDAATSEGGRVYRAVMSRVEMPLLRQALELSAGNQLKAARLLGINRNTLRKRLRLLGLLPAARTNGHGVKTT